MTATSTFPPNAAAVIPAAGASRASWGGAGGMATSDAMLPLAGKPAIYWTLQQLAALGIRRVCIVVAHRGNDLEEFATVWFGQQFELTFVAPGKLAGVGYSVVLGAEKFADSPPLLVVLGDTIPKFQVSAPIRRSTVFVAHVDDFSRWCLAQIKDGRVEILYDKPRTAPPTQQALIGIYYFSHGRNEYRNVVATAMKEGRRIEMHHLLQPTVDRGELFAEEASDWLDAGNIDHVYASQARLIQSRSFNRLQVNPIRGTIVKTSAYESKFVDEIRYFGLLPPPLRVYFPRVVSCSTETGALRLELEYYAYPTLSDLFLFERLNRGTWKMIFQRLRLIIDEFSSYNGQIDKQSVRDIYITKNIERLAEFRKNVPPLLLPYIDADELQINGTVLPGLDRTVAASKPLLEKLCETTRSCPIHGDMCFSNILCEPARGLIKFIDPRGSFGRKGAYGDPRYDLAKLNHSVNGLYDYINNDLFTVTACAEGLNVEYPRLRSVEDVQTEFHRAFSNPESSDINIITGWLFLSMLPLHADSPRRQAAFFVRGLEILNQSLS